MTPYLLTFSILAFFSLTQFTKELKKQKFLFFLFSSIYLVLFTGLRNLGVGADDLPYYEIFLTKTPDFFDWIFGSFSYNFTAIRIELGYLLLNSFIRIFTDEYEVLFLAVALLSVGIASYNYYNYSKYIFLTLLLFFAHTYLYRDMNQIRAAIASAIALFLIAQIHNRKHFKIYVTFFFMSLFHIASLSLIIAYFMSFLKITRNLIILIYSISLFLGFFTISQTLLYLIPNGGFLALKLQNYTANTHYINSVSLFDITNIKNSVILLATIVFWNRLEKVTPYFKTLVLFYVIAVSIRIAFWDLGVISARISTFFAIVEVILIPYFIYIFKQKVLIASMIILYGFLMIYLNLFVKAGRYPYELSIF
jgi:hypothetical protein